MDTFNNTQRKRRWKLADLFPDCWRVYGNPSLNLLTSCGTLLDNPRTASALLAVGRRKPVLSKGENSPIITSAFLCPSKTQAFVRFVLRHGGLSWEAERPTAPLRGFPSPFQPVAHALGSMDGGYSSFSKGFTA